jgi:hypothetical protein
MMAYIRPDFPDRIDGNGRRTVPNKETIERARRDAREGKSASTQAGEFVREEIEEIRAGKHGARSAKQAIAIGLSKARRAGVDLPPPKKGRVSEQTRRNAEQDYRKGREGKAGRPSPKRSRATLKALRRERTESASPQALSRQARSAAAKRSPEERSAAARKAAGTRRKSS